MELCDEKNIRALLARYDIRANKAFGQHFIASAEAIKCMTRAAGIDKNTGVLEIGPGLGALTRALCETGGQVVCLELDKSLQPVLRETLADFDNVTVLWRDALHTDAAALVRDYFHGLKPVVCANLPYQISTPMLEKLLTAGVFDSITVMVQKEMARRLLAEPGTKEYSFFTVTVQNLSCPVIIEAVPADCFVPRPHVDSVILHLPVIKPRCAHRLFRRVTRAAFAQRRKTLANNLCAAFPLTREEAVRVLTCCGLDPLVRGERLTIAQWERVCKGLEDYIRES